MPLTWNPAVKPRSVIINRCPQGKASLRSIERVRLFVNLTTLPDAVTISTASGAGPGKSSSRLSADLVISHLFQCQHQGRMVQVTVTFCC